MSYIIIFLVATPLFALIFSGVTLGLGLFWDRFKISGGSGFKEIYLRFLAVSAVYVILSLIGIGGILGLLIMGWTYKVTFGAGIVEALVIGILGGIIGWVIFIGLAATVLATA